MTTMTFKPMLYEIQQQFLLPMNLFLIPNFPLHKSTSSIWLFLTFPASSAYDFSPLKPHSLILLLLFLIVKIFPYLLAVHFPDFSAIKLFLNSLLMMTHIPASLHAVQTSSQ